MLKTFKIGGVHPKENKLSAASAIKVLPIPSQVVIMLGQSLGAPAVPVVNKGDKVLVGQLIAKGESFISANVHSSVSGTVNKIDDCIDSSGYRRRAIVIDVEGDEWMSEIDRSAELNKVVKNDRQEIIEIMKSAGIVGLGGATFPSHVKMMIPEGKTATHLIINAVECEPYLTSDHRIMLEKPEEVMVGIGILMRALKVNKAIIGIENNKPDAITKLTSIAHDYPGIEVIALKVRYPQGAEKQLIKACINREVPSGKLPIEVGCVVQNVGTAFAVYEAVQKNKPLFERVVTLTGKSVDKPANYLTRIGTPVKCLIEQSGGMPVDAGKVINGGPMMGKAVSSTDAPVTKGTSGILIMPEKESKRIITRNCIRCARCTQVCPMGLEPFLLGQLSDVKMWDDSEKNRVTDCIECGSCQYTCPSGRPLLDQIRLSKSTVGDMIRKRKNQ